MLPDSPHEPAAVLRGTAEACFCEVHELSATGATLKLNVAPPVGAMLLSFQFGAEHVVVPVDAATQAQDGRVAVSFARTCEQRLERLLAAAA